MKKASFLFSCFFTLFLAISPLSAAAPTYNKHSPSLSCSPALRAPVSKIQSLPEAQSLIATIQQEGPIRVMETRDPLARKFGAFWDAGRRTIYVHPDWHHSEGELIGTIIFELHNALNDARFIHFDRLAEQGRISRDQYVEGVEHIEYENSLMASRLAQKGIDAGLFPRSAHLFVYRDFDEHFFYQKKGGHSDQIAHAYDQITGSAQRLIR